MLNTDVVIIGAGPVGLNLSLCLHHLGIKHLIIDKKSAPNTTSNAIGVNPRTLEVWETLGFVDKALENGCKLQFASWYNKGVPLAKIDFSAVKSKYNFMLSLPQSQTEHLLNAQLGTFSSGVMWNSELIAYQKKDNKILVSYNNNGTQKVIETSWLIGCDGYHSSVRELTNITRNCHDLTQHFIMIDAQLSGSPATNELSVSFHDDGVLFFFPMKNSMRVVAEISHDPKYQNVAITPSQPHQEVFTDILHTRFPGSSVKEIEWASAFYVHECLATTYYKNHVILCGDAAHTHSPAGGQGMNTGIQDTWNLAWKLKHIINHEASEKLLDTYHSERQQIGLEVLQRSGKMTAAGTTNSKLLKMIRNFALSHIVNIKAIGSKFVNTITQTDICYKTSRLIDYKRIAQGKIFRYQLDKIEWLLLTKNAIDPQQLPKFIRSKQEADNPLVAKWQFCLIRPDGYIALYVNSLEEVNKFFAANNFSTS